MPEPTDEDLKLKAKREAMTAELERIAALAKAAHLATGAALREDAPSPMPAVHDDDTDVDKSTDGVKH